MRYIDNKSSLLSQSPSNSTWTLFESLSSSSIPLSISEALLLLSSAGLILGSLFDLRSEHMTLVYIELAMFVITLFFMGIVRRKKEASSTMTKALAIMVLLTFDLLILYSAPEELKIIWLFVYSALFFFFMGIKAGLVWSSMMYLSLLVLKAQPFIPMNYSVSQLIYFIIVSSLLDLIIIYYLDMMENSQKIIQDQRERLMERNSELESLAVTDRLTGINNRRRLDDGLESELQRARRYDKGFGMIMLDIDNFKKINDTYGHQRGDKVLSAMAMLLKKYSRDTDIVGRFGGEEFLLICCETDIKGTTRLSQKLLEEIRAYDFPIVGQMTVSLGVTLFQADDISDTILKRADDALYCSKAEGRDCMTIR